MTDPQVSAPRLERTYAEAFPALAAEARPVIPAASRVVWVNEPLAAELGLDAAWLATAEGLAWLTGSGEDAPPSVALAYSGFQFGNFSPILGDGRAHLTGELVGEGDARVDLHLKGSGLTGFSRPGSDGKAPLTAVWREAVIGEALHGMGVPTSRALAVIETGEQIYRRGPRPEPAGILVRVAASHLRVGTFHYAHMNLSIEDRARLVRYSLQRHYPHLLTDREGDEAHAKTLLRAVAKRQAQLVAAWMGLGFVHGVLNTDNVSISGQAIDFGPCAFIDEFSRSAVFSSIDRQGRYAYRNQPGITQWNLTRFAESLLDLIHEDPNRAVHEATDVLAEFEEHYRRAYLRVFAAKLGVELSAETSAGIEDEVAGLIEATLDMLEAASIDFTGFFRALTETDDPAQLRLPGGARVPETGEDSLGEWAARLTRVRELTGTSAESSQELMETANPVYIPRNWRLEEALNHAAAGDPTEVLRIIDAVRTPFTRDPRFTDLEDAPASSAGFVTFCGT